MIDALRIKQLMDVPRGFFVERDPKSGSRNEDRRTARADDLAE
jgi:hypothetical protein